MTDLVAPEYVVDWRTGELVPPGDTERVADILHAARDQQSELRKITMLAEAALLAAMDAEARWTLRIPGFRLTGDSPDAADIDWDLDVLAELEQHLPPARYHECVQEIVSYKPVTAELRRVARAGGAIAEIIQRAEHRKPKRRRVTVSRKQA